VDNASQVILRNEDRLGGKSLLIINPLRDLLAQGLMRDGRPLRLSTQDFGDAAWLEAAGFPVSFEAVPGVSGEESTVILHLPREKDRLSLLLHAVSARLSPAARLWLVGENRAGIRSSARYLDAHFGAVEAIDKARHCVLYEAREPRLQRPFGLADYLTAWSLRLDGEDLQLLSLPGVFAHGRLDRGSELLLDALRQLKPAGRVLDFACGCGVLGLALLRENEKIELTLLDSSAVALESCRRSMDANGLRASMLPSDGLASVSERYDWIVSNPPFHRGVRSDLGVAADFFREAGTFLTENGKIVIVFNRHLPYLRWLQHAFDRVDLLGSGGDFTIVQAGRPNLRRGQ
jgi:16S rRNA (guanine1207-N2)-methyltransferase